MNPTSIENKPRIYEVPTLLVKPQRTDIIPINIPENYYFQYIFNFNLNNVIDTTSCNLYPLTRKLNSSGNITYNSRSVDLNGSSYLSRDIDFDLKTLSFWFNLEYANIDNYLLSTDDNNFYIKVNSNVLSIKVNTDIKNITNDFIADNWYHLALTYYDTGYDIYIDQSILTEKIDSLITNPITLNIGKKSGVFDNDGNIDVIDITLTDITSRKYHSMVAIGTNIYIFGGWNNNSKYLNDFYKIDTSTYSVEEITATGITTISERGYHSMVAIDTDIYIFGGYNGSHLNDFYKINITTINPPTYSVEEITSNGFNDTISIRSNHTMVAIGTDIYIYGGYNSSSEYLNDFYKIDTTNNTATEITIPGFDGNKRRQHSMVEIGTDIYIYGGIYDFPNGHLNDFYKINTINCNVVYSNNSLSNITERADHSMVKINNDIYIYGGNDDVYNVTNSLNDFYKITGDSYFTGNIADLRLYNYPITPQEIQENKLPEPTIYIQYNFDNTLDKSSSSIYEDSLTLTSNVDIQYHLSPISVYLNGSSYLSTDIAFDLKTLSFWFKPINVNIDNYLLSTDDNNFYIKVNSNELSIKVNTDTKNIISDFTADNWYHLVLTYNEPRYDIYIDNSILDEKIYSLISNPITLNIGKKSEVPVNSDDLNVIQITPDGFDNYITTKNNYSMVAIDTDIYIFGDNVHFNKIDTINCNVVYRNTAFTDISARRNYSMVAIGTDIYIYGGFDSGSWIPFNDFYKINTITCNVVHSDTNLNGISARGGYSMVAIDPYIYIFGGSTSKSGSFKNDFYKINTINCNVVYSNTFTNISARRDHSMVAIGTDIYIFGGRNGMYLNDFYKIDTINCNVVHSTTFTNISGRAFASIEAIDTDIYIYGGYSFDTSTIFNDFCKIDTIYCNVVYSNNDFTDFTDISARYLHSMAAIGTDIYIYGGRNSGNTYLNDFYKIATVYDSYFTGNIADLRLYNYSITAEEITTIYNDSLNSMKDIIHTKMFSGTTPGNTSMLDDVPEETTILNIVINTEAILYNENYGEGSGLYIDFNKSNLRYVGQVNITNNGKIYGRGGIGQTSSSDNQYIGKYAIKVLSDDSITRVINITNNGDGEILGGGNGGIFIENYVITYTEKKYVVQRAQWKQIAQWYFFETNTRPDGVGTDNSYYSQTPGDEQEYTSTISIPGINAHYFDGTAEIISDSDHKQSFAITDDLRTGSISISTIETAYEWAGWLEMKWWRYHYTYSYPIDPKTTSHTIESGIHYYTKNIDTGTQGFDTTKDIEVLNNFIIVNRIS